jgi:hypothetical protein
MDMIRGFLSYSSMREAQTQPSAVQPPTPDDEKLPITPHLDDVVFGEAYFATAEEPLRTHLFDASRRSIRP